MRLVSMKEIHLLPFSVSLSPSYYDAFIRPLSPTTSSVFSALSRRFPSPVNQVRHSLHAKSNSGAPAGPLCIDFLVSINIEK